MEMEFTIQDIVPIAIVFVVTTIVLSFGASITNSVKDTQGLAGCTAKTNGFTHYNATSQLCYNSSGSTQQVGTYAFNTTDKGLESLATFGTNLPLLATIVIAAIIITILVVYLGGRLMGK